jgi:hypothetical protein
MSSAARQAQELMQTGSKFMAGYGGYDDESDSDLEGDSGG